MADSILAVTPLPAEAVVAVPFPVVAYMPGPKVPVLVQAVDGDAGDLLWISAEAILDWKPFGLLRNQRAVFVASQLRLVDGLPPTDTALHGVPLGPANGSNANASVPYVVVHRSGAGVVPAGLAAPTVVLYVWVSSEAAQPGDALPVVPGYGQLRVLRVRP